jgi:predicted solute-binding protein
VAGALRDAAAIGINQIDQIARQQAEYPKELARNYLTKHIGFKLGDLQVEGLERFSAELEACGFVQRGRAPLDFV